MIDITYIVLGLITIISGVLIRYLVPWIKSNVSAKDLATAYKWVMIGCKAADQLVKTGVISKDDRKQHVIDFLQENGITLNLEQIDEMIESICLELPSLLVDDSEDKSEDDSVLEYIDK
jgi:hypothetical protein